MTSFRDILTLALLFISLYFEIFMLITYFEHRKKILRIYKSGIHQPNDLPSVTIVVPCFNEEKTVGKTVDSLLALDYPTDKLRIVIVNDGSTDQTLNVLGAYSKYEHIKIISKDNGGKHTALNLAIEQSETEFIGCLDADSYARPDSLLRLIKRFDRPEIMAVVPSLQVFKPKTIIQRIQKVEYIIGALMRSILAELNALYVTPGPFSIFRRKVFDEIGYYKKAHNTEDMEMAMRMQSKGLTIASAHDAVVFTSSPQNLLRLYKQRVRWTSGFLNNMKDYRFMLFNINYGNIGLFVLPFMVISAGSILLVVSMLIYDAINIIHTWIIRYEAIGTNIFDFTWPSFNLFSLHTTPLLFCGVAAICIILTFIILGSRQSSGNRAKILEVASYMCLYSFIAPWWVIKSIYNVTFARQSSWR